MAEWGSVSNIKERHTLTDRGELRKIYHIEATTKKGTIFTFDVGEDQIDKESVNRIAQEKAEALDGLLDL